MKKGKYYTHISVLKRQYYFVEWRRTVEWMWMKEGIVWGFIYLLAATIWLLWTGSNFSLSRYP
jgi:hypothetical protein